MAKTRFSPYDGGMGFALRFACVFLLSAATLTQAESNVDALIQQLGDRDPNVRGKAYDDLVKAGEDARPKLVEASRSASPAIAEAAKSLVAKLPWVRPGDSPEISKLLRPYGAQNPQQRTQTLLKLSQSEAPDARSALLRVLMNEPASEVLWNAVTGISVTKEWSDDLAKVDRNTAPAPVLVLIARERAIAGDIEEARTLVRTAGEDTEGLEVIAPNGDLRLFDLAARLDLDDQAANHLDRALDKLGPDNGLTLTRGQATESWNYEDARTTAIWYRYKGAIARKDQVAADTIAKDLLDRKSPDMAIFLDVLPTLEKIAKSEEVDAYFDKVYEHQQAKMTASPDEPVHKNDLAWLAARSGRKLTEALGFAEAAVKAKPDSAAYLDTLAEVKFRLGLIDEAIKLEERAIELDPKEPFMKEQLERFKKAR